MNLLMKTFGQLLVIIKLDLRIDESLRHAKWDFDFIVMESVDSFEFLKIDLLLLDSFEQLFETIFGNGLVQQSIGPEVANIVDMTED